jgi:hypothetical protein
MWKVKTSIEIEPPQKVHRLNQQIHPLLGVQTTIIFTTLSSESFGNKNNRLIDCREMPKQKVHLYIQPFDELEI